MKKVLIFRLLFIIFLTIILFIYFFEFNKDDEVVDYELSKEFESINLYNKNKELVFSYNISDFRNWAKNNWTEIFDELPAFGEVRQVEIDNFDKYI